MSKAARRRAHRSAEGFALLAKGQSQEAEARFREALADRADDPDPLHGLGVLALQAGDFAEAERLLRRSARTKPTSSVHCNLATALLALGRAQEAVGAARMATRQDPKDPDAAYNLGNALRQSGDLAGAAEAFRRATALAPEHPAAWHNLGDILADLREWAAAAQALARAVDLAPRNAHAWNTLGLARRRLGQATEARAAFELATALDPAYASAWCNLGSLFAEQSMPSEARHAASRALALHPGLAHAHTVLSLALRAEGDLAGALREAEAACAAQPDLGAAHSARSQALFRLWRLEEAIEASELAARHDPESFTLASDRLIQMRYSDRCPAPQHLRAAREFGTRFASGPSPAPVPNGKPKRVGFVGGDFRNHPVGRILVSLLEGGLAERFEVVLYSTMPASDAVTDRLRRVAGWRDVRALDDPAAASLIRSDRIDVLIDLSGHSAGHRLPLFGLRPAPVQLTWLGYPGTTGVEAIDAALVDRWLAPTEDAAAWSERLARLPGPFLVAPFDLREVGAASPAIHPPTFGSFNNPAKITPATVALWSDCLHAAPEARLLLKYRDLDQPAVQQRVRGAFAEMGVDPARIAFAGHTPPREHEAWFGQVDVALDPLPYGGTSTTLDFLARGVPVVTLRGVPLAQARAGTALLEAVGHPEWAPDTPEGFAQVAVGLLRRKPTGLREQFLASPLCDARRFAEGFAQTLDAVWDACRDRIELTPLLARAWEKVQTGQASTAEPLLSTALRHAPADARVLHLVGLAHFVTGHAAEACDWLARAADADPLDPELLANYGAALRSARRTREAAAVLRHAVTLDPSMALAHNNLGTLASDAADYGQAREHFAAAVAADPALASAHGNLGLCDLEEGKLDEAEASLRRALELDPRQDGAMVNLARVRHSRGDTDDALRLLRRAVEIKPTNRVARSNLLYTLQSSLRHGPAERLAAARQFGPLPGGRVELTASARPTLGFISGDLSTHPVGFFLQPLLERVRRTHRVVLFPNAVREDAQSAVLRGLADAWVPLEGLEARPAAERIAMEGVDVLVDLSGHTAKNRLDALAFRPGRLQVSFLGYSATTGLPEMDVMLADRWVAPAEECDQFTEEVRWLPDSLFCYQPPAEAGSPTPTPHSGLRFGSFNNPAKISPGALALWVRLLREVPKATLVLKYRSFGCESVARRFREAFASAGIDPGRLELHDWTSRADHFALYRSLDVALDPFPYNGATTTCEALWMGVPVVSLRGERYVGHMAESVLQTAGFGGWVASTEDAYIEQVRRLAEARPDGIREQVAASALCDPDRYAAGFLAAVFGAAAVQAA